VPLLQTLIPLKVAEIDPADKSVALAGILLVGAAAAGLSNMIGGAVSDRTRSRLGRRRPWLLLGALGAVSGYGLIAAAHTLPALMFGVAFFQVTFNLMFAALLALVVDRVPERRRGLVTALLGLGYPVGSVVGASLIGYLVAGQGPRLLALGLVVLAAIVPFALVLKDPPTDHLPARPWRREILSWGFWVSPLRNRDFALAFSGRLVAQIGLSLVQSYMLFYLVEQIHISRSLPGRTPEYGMAILTSTSVVANVVAALISGLWSDRSRRRKPFVITGAATLALATVGFALTRSWSQLLWEYGLFGVGMGIYYSVDMAMVTELLPSHDDTAKDLGCLNLANTIPQVVSPLIAVALLGDRQAGFQGLFLTAAGLMLTGALLVAPIRRAR